MLDDRYYAPHARALFNPDEKFRYWTMFSGLFAREAVTVDLMLTGEQRDDIYLEFNKLEAPDAKAVRTREGYTGHEVVAFLELLEQQLPQSAARYLHYGLTSSDLVDNTLMYTLRLHATYMADLIERFMLSDSRCKWADTATPRAGRTHGQIADVTLWSHQVQAYTNVLEAVQRGLRQYAEHRVLKSPGPTGRPGPYPALGFLVAKELNARIITSTQVIHRDHLLRWACLYVRLAGILENLALQIRLGARSDIREVAEGAADNRVGSSAMPHKKNPIDSEKVCGLARVVRGQFATLAEGVALWEDRDLTNSSMERVVVPELAATVEHMMLTMMEVFNNLHVDVQRMRATARKPETITNLMQVMAQKHLKIGPVAASKAIRKALTEVNPDNPYPMSWIDGVHQALVKDYGKGAADRWRDEVIEIRTSMFGSE